MLSKKEIQYIKKVIDSAVNTTQLLTISEWIDRLYNKIEQEQYLKLQKGVTFKCLELSYKEIEGDKYV